MHAQADALVTLQTQPHIAARHLGGGFDRAALLGHQLPAGAGLWVLAVGLWPRRVRRGERLFPFTDAWSVWVAGSMTRHVVACHCPHTGLRSCRTVQRLRSVCTPGITRSWSLLQIVIASVIEDRIQRRYYLVPFTARVKRPKGGWTADSLARISPRSDPLVVAWRRGSFEPLWRAMCCAARPSSRQLL